MDLRRNFIDGKRLFGKSKTWFGAVSIILVAAVLAIILGLGITTGLLAGTGVVCGDLLSSFIKRRLGLRPSSMALGLDQVPESLLPLLLLTDRYGFSSYDILLGVLCFTALELLISRLLYRWHVREKPY